jgi:hypothetical protein
MHTILLLLLLLLLLLTDLYVDGSDEDFGSGGSHLKLISTDKPVKSDIPGNLADASVVTKDNSIVMQHMKGDLNKQPDEKNRVWLTERWQASPRGNMQGAIVRGQHWLEIDLERSVSASSIHKVILHWENAYASQFFIVGRSENGIHHYIGSHEEVVDTTRQPQHVVMTMGKLPVSTTTRLQHAHTGSGERLKGVNGIDTNDGLVRYIRIILKRPGTQWGTSLWRVQLWGTE